MDGRLLDIAEALEAYADLELEDLPPETRRALDETFLRGVAELLRSIAEPGE